MVTIDGTTISGATIDGTPVKEITVDGNTVWRAMFESEGFEGGSISASAFSVGDGFSVSGGGEVLTESDGFGYSDSLSVNVNSGTYALAQYQSNFDITKVEKEFDEKGISKVSWNMSAAENGSGDAVVNTGSSFNLYGPNMADDNGAIAKIKVRSDPNDNDYTQVVAEYTGTQGDKYTTELYRNVDYNFSTYYRNCSISHDNNGNFTFDYNGNTTTESVNDVYGNALPSDPIEGIAIETFNETGYCYDDISVTRNL